jgi:hypothetical protein
MFKTKEIFSKYEDEVSQLQFRNFYPISTLHLNDENKKTTFKFDLEDDFISKNNQYYIAGEFVPTDSTVRIIDNFVAPLFTQIEVQKHGTLIDDNEFPGIASTIKGCVELPGLNVYNGKAINSGFETHSKYETKQFEALGNLADLGLGFFNDISVLIYKGGLEITFTRNSDNNAIVRWEFTKPHKSKETPPEGKMEIKAFYLRVPIIEYNSEAKINLTDELFKNNYYFQFKKWQCIRQMKVTGKTLNLDITNLYRDITNPVWAFVVFKQID